MDHERAIAALEAFVEAVDRYASLFGDNPHNAFLDFQRADDDVRRQLPIAAAIVAAARPDEAEEVADHPDHLESDHWKRARKAVVAAVGAIEGRAELEAILGPTGPQLAARDLHSVVWSAAVHLWDDGHHPQAVQTAAVALEGHLQAKVGPVEWIGEGLATAFNVSPGKGPRLRLPGLVPGSKTWVSAHEGAAALVRGAMLGIRNLVSHHGAPVPSADEALEQLAVLSHVCRLIDRSVIEPQSQGR